jgi:hypothetical protein
MDRNRINLEFADYVDLKTVERWEAEERRLAAQVKTDRAEQKVVSSAAR